MARPDYVIVLGMLDLVELHLLDRKGRLVGIMRGVNLVQADRPSEGPAGAPAAREAKE